MSAQRSAIFCLAAAFAAPAFAFDSGSTGADGVLNPNVDTEVVLPPSGVLNYTSINIPTGVTVRFKRNALNTPVTLLVSGAATIAGTIDISGLPGADSNGAGNGNIADDGLPGAGGPGGFAGGVGGKFDPNSNAPRFAQGGIGPGGGKPSNRVDGWNCFGGSGTFGSKGDASPCYNVQADIYGNADLLPLVGGSGGAGGIAYINSGGGGGGGGGGAILIAVSGTLQLTGSINALGAHGGNLGNNYNEGGAVGGAGSGGAVRLVATTLSGNGAITATGGRVGKWINYDYGWGAGVGRIRLEAEVFQRNAATNPAFSQAAPGPIVVAGVPTIRIASVGGVNAPAAPTGNGDIVLPADAPNPVAVGLATTNVPLGTTISVILTPAHGAITTSISSGLQGTEAAATASANISLPDGPSVLLATLSFTVAGTQQLAYARYTGGERVVQVEASSDMHGVSHTVFTTISGRKVTL